MTIFETIPYSQEWDTDPEALKTISEEHKDLWIVRVVWNSGVPTIHVRFSGHHHTDFMRQHLLSRSVNVTRVNDTAWMVVHNPSKKGRLHRTMIEAMGDMFTDHCQNTFTLTVWVAAMQHLFVKLLMCEADKTPAYAVIGMHKHDRTGIQKHTDLIYSLMESITHSDSIVRSAVDRVLMRSYADKVALPYVTLEAFFRYAYYIMWHREYVSYIITGYDADNSKCLNGVIILSTSYCNTIVHLAVGTEPKPKRIGEVSTSFGGDSPATTLKEVFVATVAEMREQLVKIMTEMFYSDEAQNDIINRVLLAEDRHIVFDLVKTRGKQYIQNSMCQKQENAADNKSATDTKSATYDKCVKPKRNSTEFTAAIAKAYLDEPARKNTNYLAFSPFIVKDGGNIAFIKLVGKVNDVRIDAVISVTMLDQDTLRYRIDDTSTLKVPGGSVSSCYFGVLFDLIVRPVYTPDDEDDEKRLDRVAEGILSGKWTYFAKDSTYDGIEVADTLVDFSEAEFENGHTIAAITHKDYIQLEDISVRDMTKLGPYVIPAMFANDFGVSSFRVVVV